MQVPYPGSQVNSFQPSHQVILGDDKQGHQAIPEQSAQIREHSLNQN